MRRLFHLISAAGLALLAGCGGPKAYVRPGFLEHPPRRIAVLPFAITYVYDVMPGQPIPAVHRIGRDMFRKIFYYAVTPYGYEDVALDDVDHRLAALWGPIEDGGWRAATPSAIGDALGADALVYGELHRLVYVATPLYTQTSLDATLRMVEASSGEELWRTRVRVAERGGALFSGGQAVDFLQDQARSFNPSVKFLRLADVAVRQALKDFPNLPMPTQASAGGQVNAEAHQAVRLALLPLNVKRPGWRQGAELLRSDLAASLQESPFAVLEVNQVDAALATFGWQAGEPIPADLSLPTFAQATGADVVLRGTVTNWGKSYLVVESWVKAELHLELVDARSGEVIWSEKRKDIRQAGLTKVPTGYKAIVMAPIMGLKTSHLERVATHLTREMVHDLSTAPVVLAYVQELGARDQ